MLSFSPKKCEGQIVWLSHDCDVAVEIFRSYIRTTAWVMKVRPVSVIMEVLRNLRFLLSVIRACEQHLVWVVGILSKPAVTRILFVL